MARQKQSQASKEREVLNELRTVAQCARLMREDIMMWGTRPFAATTFEEQFELPDQGRFATVLKATLDAKRTDIEKKRIAARKGAAENANVGGTDHSSSVG